MWTEITRPQYLRKGLRYASDVTEAEWRMIEPRLPAPRRLGRPRKTALLAVVNALFYIARTGCQWRMLPGDFPHYSTVQRYFYAWRDDGTLQRINFELLLQARETAGREPSPSAGVIDSQSVKNHRERRAVRLRRRQEGQKPAPAKAGGRKRHILTDTLGLLVEAAIHPADVQDRDGAVLVIQDLYDLFPWLRHLFADGAYAGQKLRDALAKFGNWTVQIVRRSDQAAGFEIIPRRWVVERTFAWLNRNRRLAKDFEASIASAKAWLLIASVQLLVKRVARI
jgi:transposase